MSVQVLQGDALERLRELPDGSVHCCITSPPYFGLRDYGTGEWEGGDAKCDHTPPPTRASASSTLKNDGRPNPGAKAYEAATPTPYRDTCGKCGATRVDHQIGLEPTPDEYVAKMVEVFREVKRVLRDDGTLWLNLGDSYAATSTYNTSRSMHSEAGWKQDGERRPNVYAIPGVKPKDLLGIPWMVAFALRADGWYLRSEIIWAKPNPMPESVTDRPTKAHEQVFLLSKQPRYYFDADAIREPNQPYEFATSNGGLGKGTPPSPQSEQTLRSATTRAEKFATYNPAGRNKRSVWTVATQPYPEAHFATFPPKLIEPMVLAGAPRDACGVCGAPWERVVEREPMVVRASERSDIQGDAVNDRRTATSGTMLSPPTSKTTGWQPTCAHDNRSGSGVVLDPFAGSGTTLQVALANGREAIGIELNPEYARLIERRLLGVTPSMFDA